LSTSLLIMFDTLFLRPSLQCNTPLHFTTLIDTSLPLIDGTHAETRFRLSAKRTSPFKPTWASFQSTTGSRVVPISGSNARYTMFRGSVKSSGYHSIRQFPLHFPPPRASLCANTFQEDSTAVAGGCVAGCGFGRTLCTDRCQSQSTMTVFIEVQN
jgi:hypothetical protein